MKRLLFVDDEQRVLDGLRQSLRAKRREWEMVFAASTAAAFEELTRSAFDVVISDMRMPGIDGADFLQRVRQLQPEALRIVLSGQMDESAAVRAAATAHRFVAKPCDSGTLVTILNTALELREGLRSEELRRCIGGLTALPSLPAACEALRRTLEREQATLAEVTQLIVRDVGVSARVLQLVNSGFFGLPRHIAGVEQAVSYLGLDTLRSLMRENALFHEPRAEVVGSLESAQTHALLAARYAGLFALSGRGSDVALTATLLRHVGRVALTTCESNAAPCAGDAEVGAYLLGLWGLPNEVIAAAAFGERAWESLPTLDAGAVVELADSLATRALEPGAHTAAEPSPATLARLGIAEIVGAIVDGERGRQASRPRQSSVY